MNSFIPAIPNAESRHRQWRARLRLELERRDDRTALVTTDHEGPLRVQRPFYPESDGCCHVYLLHPPGGMVIGDSLQLDARIAAHAAALLTTPSAGKIYGAQGSLLRQEQCMRLDVAESACLEWLPQETIVFDGANGNLRTQIFLHGNATAFGWDIVRLGRAASGEKFIHGQCRQAIEIWRDGQPLFIERNKFIAGSDFMIGRWGMWDANTTGMLFATVKLAREKTDALVAQLDAIANRRWGLTQKGELFLARYLGNSASECRRGFEFLWREVRPLFNGKPAVSPRIWNT